MFLACANGLKARVLRLEKQFLAIEKPIGILSQPDFTRTESIDESVRKFLIQHYEKPGNAYLGPLHRLDRVASGIMIFATTSKAAGRMASQFRNREIEKEYLGVVSQSKLYKSQGGTISGSGGDEGDLEWNRLKDIGKSFTLIRIRIQTGKKHQIRQQLTRGGIGPLVGDTRYGYRGIIPKHFPTTDAVMLHAYKLAFNHPITPERRIRLSCPPNQWPQEFWPNEFIEKKTVENEEIKKQNQV